MSIWANVLEAWTVARTKFAPPLPAFHLHGEDARAELAAKALSVAVSCLGHGEEGGNNMGPFVAACVAPAKVPQNWCGGFVGWCYAVAGHDLGMTLPFQRSLGAKKLGSNVAAVGRRFTDPAEARPGDLMVFDRGAQGSWQGHVGLVELVVGRVVGTVEGNSGPKVMRRERHAAELSGERFSFFASLRRG